MARWIWVSFNTFSTMPLAPASRSVPPAFFTWEKHSTIVPMPKPSTWSLAAAAGLAAIAFAIYVYLYV